jgi:hypothetical protein
MYSQKSCPRSHRFPPPRMLFPPFLLIRITANACTISRNPESTSSKADTTRNPARIQRLRPFDVWTPIVSKSTVELRGQGEQLCDQRQRGYYRTTCRFITELRARTKSTNHRPCSVATPCRAVGGPVTTHVSLRPFSPDPLSLLNPVPLWLYRR